MWSRKGGRVPLPGGAGFQEVSADYLSMPLLLRFSGRTRFRPYAVSGLEVAFRLSARTRLKAGAVDVTERSIDDIEPVDMAAAMGAGIERMLARSTVFVEALYSHGLRNVLADSPDLAYARTRTTTLLAAFVSDAAEEAGMLRHPIPAAVLPRVPTSLMVLRA